MSVALEICRLVEERAGPGGPASVATVGVEVGEDAGVEISSLAFCLEAVFAAPPFKGAKPAITTLPGDVLRLAYLEVDDGRPAH